MKPKKTKQPKQSSVKKTAPKTKKQPASSKHPRWEVSDHEAELSHIDEFAQCVLDPKTHLAPFPGNTFDTTCSRQRISIDSSLYSDDGDVNLYIFPNPETPAYFSRRISTTYTGGNAPAFVASQPISVSSVGEATFFAPMFFANGDAVFNAPVTFTGGAPPQNPMPGYRMTVTDAAMSLSISHDLGFVGRITVWTRTALGSYSATVITPAPTVVTSTVSIPVGHTAFGVLFSADLPTENRVYITQGGGGAHGLSIGNHAAYCARYTIPDAARMGIKRSRVIGLSSLVTYRGADIYNAGNIATMQFQPGTYPSQFAGLDMYNQMIASESKTLYTGPFAKGTRGVFIGPNDDFYSLDSTNARYGEQGILCQTWNSFVGQPQRYIIEINIVIEYTTSLSFVPKTIPPTSGPKEIRYCVALLNRMQVNTENPTHPLVLAAWNKIKGMAKHIVTSDRLWITVAEVVGSAALL